MSKFTIPNTDVSLKGTLKDGGAFADSSGTSLNTYGSSNRIPRVTSNISIDSHFRNRDFVRFVNVFAVDGNGNALGGSLQVTSPFSLGPSDNISLGVNRVFDTSAQTTITVQANAISSFTFQSWQDHAFNNLSFNNPATLSLTNATVAAATEIRGVYSFDGGGGGSS